MDTIYSFGYWVRRRRKALDLTQRELAEAVGCALVTLKKIESDQRRPSPEMAVRLAHCLDLPATERDAFLAAARGERLVDVIPLPAPAFLPPRDVLPWDSDAIGGVAAATPIIGREAEIATVTSLLARPDTRLVTLVGHGGIGKTRLSLAAAAALRRTQPRPFPAGIVFVDLAAVNEAAQMGPAIAAALAFELETGGRHDPGTPLDQLAGFLSPRDTLLILDNLEQVDGGREVIDRLLRATATPKILATSRERLDLPWEHLVALPGLAYASGPVADPEAYPAGQLFLARAGRLRPDFALDSAGRVALTELCALVDGMPLALELAAAWVDTLSLTEIVDELRHDLGLPDGFRDGLPERHRSLKAVWDSAWDRLSADEQSHLARLCIFRGGFTRAAAEAVAGITLGLLGRLTGKYFITLDRGAGRYRVHELLRQYGYARLEQLGDAAETRRRHFDYFLAFAAAQRRRLFGPEQGDALSRLAAETDNLNLALEWGLAGPNGGEVFVALASALHWFWRMRSRLVEASTWAERALLLSGRPPAAEAQLLYEAGHFAWMRGEFETARDRHAAALALWKSAGLGESLEAAVTRQHLAMAIARLDGEGAADPLYNAALARYRELGETWWIAFILPRIARTRQTLGDGAAADAATAEHLQLAARLGDPWLTGLGRLNLGENAIDRGDYRVARQLLEEGLVLQRATGHFHSVGSALMMLGDIAVKQGDPAAAATYYKEALQLYEGMGHARYATEARRLLETTSNI